MIALMKNNYYKVIESLKIYLLLILVFTVALIFSGIKSAFDGFAPYIGFSLSMGTLAMLELTGAKNFDRQVLCFPVKRKDIVKSIYVFQFVVSILAGMIVFVFGILHIWYNKRLSLILLEICVFHSALASSMVLIVTIIYQPLSYIFTGMYKYLVILITSFLAYFLLFGVFPDYIVYRYSNPKILIFAGISSILSMIVFYILSYFASKSIFENKNIENYSDI